MNALWLSTLPVVTLWVNALAHTLQYAFVLAIRANGTHDTNDDDTAKPQMTLKSKKLPPA